MKSLDLSKALAKSLIGSLLIGGATFFIWYGERAHLENSSARKTSSEADHTAKPSAAAPGRNLSQAPITAGSTEKAKLGEFSRALQDEMNEETIIERDADGRVISIRNELGKVSRNRNGFRPNDQASVRARANEFLKENGRSFGLSLDDIKETGITTGIVSAQAYYKQTVDGVPVVPNGGVTLSFGPDGELLEYSTQVVPVNTVTNSVVLAAADAKGLLKDTSAEGGAHVMFVDQSGSAKHAYQFESKGFEVIIDAETGKTLFRRDRRMQ